MAIRHAALCRRIHGVPLRRRRRRRRRRRLDCPTTRSGRSTTEVPGTGPRAKIAREPPGPFWMGRPGSGPSGLSRLGSGSASQVFPRSHQMRRHPTYPRPTRINSPNHFLLRQTVAWSARQFRRKRSTRCAHKHHLFVIVQAETCSTWRAHACLLVLTPWREPNLRRKVQRLRQETVGLLARQMPLQAQ